MMLALAAVLALAAAQERPPTDRRALLVGIGDYGEEEGSAWENLYGPPNDLALMRALLIERFAFSEGSVKTLAEDDATHAGIVDAFWKHLIEPAGPQTEAFFYYTGHGSLAADASGHEGSGFDATLVCADSARSVAGAVPDLLDDELHSLLAALAARGARVTVITDCCHSGGLTRGDERTRGLPPSAPASDPSSFLPPEVPLLDDGDPRRPDPLPWVQISACGAEQRAHERKLENELGERLTHGLLTWHLVAGLREAAPSASWEEVVERAGAAIYEEMWSDGIAQPQRAAVSGPARRKIFGGEFAPPLPGLPARTQSGRGFLKVQAGTLHFLEPGTRLEVLELDGAALGIARVHRTRLTPTRCEAAWEGEAPQLAPGRALRVVPLDTPAGAAPVAVLAPAESAAALALAACARAGLALVAEDPAEAAVRLVERADGLWEAQDVDTGVPIFAWDAGARDAEAMLARHLREERNYRRFLRHPEATGLGAVELWWRPASAERLQSLQQWLGEECRAAALAGTGDVLDQAMLREGLAARQVVELVARLPENSGPGGHLAVLCVSEDRSITPIFPTDGDRERVLAPGKEIVIAVDLFIPEWWPVAQPQRDRYVALLTAEPLPIAALQQHGGAHATLRGATGAPARLRALLGGELRGGPATVEAGASDYSFAVRDLVLRRE
jgi:hypothetical protein